MRADRAAADVGPPADNGCVYSTGPRGVAGAAGGAESLCIFSLGVRCRGVTATRRHRTSATSSYLRQHGQSGRRGGF